MGVAIFGHIHVVDFFLRCESCVDSDSVGRRRRQFVTKSVTWLIASHG